MTVTPRLFARIVGGLLVLGALIALILPASIDDGSDNVSCGNAFSGVDKNVGYRDAGKEIADAMYPGFADDDPVTLEEQCGDAIGTRRVWGWPIAGIGLVALAGSFVQAAPRRPTGEPAA